jgi:hypothetical protein
MLKESKEWKTNKKVRKWFENTWLKHKEVCAILLLAEHTMVYV